MLCQHKLCDMHKRDEVLLVDVALVMLLQFYAGFYTGASILGTGQKN